MNGGAMEELFSVIVIGAGSAGLTAADFAARLGASTALIEASRIGGDCTWTGCIPSKALLKVAKVAHTVRRAAKFGVVGIDQSQVKMDMQHVHDRVHAIIDKIYQEERPEVWEERGVRVFTGRAEFLDPHRVCVHRQDGTKQIIQGDRFVICTGARPAIPVVVKASGVPYLTYESIFDLTELPSSLLIVGGGPIGCEIGQAFARFGSQVTILSKHLLSKEDPDVQEALLEMLQAEGIVHVGSHLKDIRQQADGRVEATAEDGTIIMADRVMIAVGRVPVIERLALAAADVEFTDSGIVTNDFLQTTTKHIYAAGDCIGSQQFTHYAAWQAFLAVRNFILPSRDHAKTTLVPRCTFTDPEVAAIGPSEEEFKQKYGAKARVAFRHLKQVDRAVTEDEDSIGFYKILYTTNGKIRGATFVCQRAGELVNEIAICISQGIKITDLGKVMHNYPSFGIAVQQMSADVVIESLMTGLTGAMVNWFKRI
eukprot:m.24214 g.24214  ORF g.24214 m.24214 type:complete len:483 (-) comp9641_c0_seq1:1376-2824(-)